MIRLVRVVSTWLMLAALCAPGSLPAAPDEDRLQPAWRWRHPARGDAETPCRFVKGGPGGASFHLVLDDDGNKGTVECKSPEGETLWLAELAPQGGDCGVLLAARERVFVARCPCIASGCVLIALDMVSGKRLWRTRLEALGPVGHSQYLNRVQLSFQPDHGLVVYGNESGGKYIEVVDPATGRSLSNRRVDERLADIPWSWTAPRRMKPYPSPISISAADGGRYRFTQSRKPERAGVRRLGPGGKLRWKAELPFQFVGDAHLLEHDGTLYVTHYCAIATGTTVYAFDGDTGARLWQTRPWGLGSIGHSKYRNQVELRWMHDHLAVFGKEAAGNYIEVLDPRTGRSLANQSFPSW